MAQSTQTPPEKIIKEIEKREGWSEIHERALNEKVMDLLETNAKIEEVAPGATA